MRKPQKILAGVLWVLAAVSVVAYLGLSRSRAGDAAPTTALTLQPVQAEPLRPLYDVGDFALVDQAGQPFAKSDLAGKAWVGFIFLRNCPTGACPTMIGKMTALQEALPASEFGDKVQFVSFSIDPDRDTPEALAEYALNASKAAGRDGTDPRWHLLTGTAEQVQGVSDAMRLGFDPHTFEHNTQFVLVDATGTVRGLYRNSVDEDMQRLAEDARALVGTRETSPGA